jgi:hypothetical protein
MNNLISMSAEFEKQKNIRASAITGGIAGSLLILFILVKWAIPVKSEPPVEEYIEINLGSSDQGFGTNQPELPGDPAPAQQANYTPSQPVHSAEESVRDVAENETSPDAPVVHKPAVSNPTATKISAESKAVKSTNTTPAPVVQPQRVPKALASRTLGGNGPGGNGADSYKPGGNQGIAGGNGDQGVVGGNPNGTRYSGTPRNMGVRIVNIPSQSFEDDFNESGKIALDIEVDGNGKLLNAAYQVNGSTLPKSSKQYAIALRRAQHDMVYPKTGDGFKQKLILKFDVR